MRDVFVHCGSSWNGSEFLVVFGIEPDILSTFVVRLGFSLI